MGGTGASGAAEGANWLQILLGTETPNIGKASGPIAPETMPLGASAQPGSELLGVTSSVGEPTGVTDLTPTRTGQDYLRDFQDIRKVATQRSKGTPPPVTGDTMVNVRKLPGWTGEELPQYPTLQSLAQARLASMRGLR